MEKIRAWLLGHPIWIAIGLSMGTALGASLTRFSYALFVPAMREDLNWSYLTAGSLNTAHALGYLLGALTLSFVIQRFSVSYAFIVGGILTSIFIGLCAFVTDTSSIGGFRFLSGLTSASVFAGGTVLIAQLASIHPTRSGLLLGIYYAGGGFGMIVSAFLVPAAINLGLVWQWEHHWQFGWLVVSIVGLVMTLCMWIPSISVPQIVKRILTSDSTNPRSYLAIGSGYFFFGMGYIGYMTFIISLLHSQGWNTLELSLFYTTIGIFGMSGAQLWSVALDKFKGGQCLALINSLLAVSCFIPAYVALNYQNEQTVLTTFSIYISGGIFGACLTSAVAATTAFVKHNMPQSQWVSAITIFTSIFAVGQVIGPSLTGWISDTSGELPIGFVVSALILFSGAVLSSLQKPLEDRGLINN